MPLEEKKLNSKIANFSVTEPKYCFDDIVLERETFNDITSAVALFEKRDLIFNKWGFSSVLKLRKTVSINLYGESGTGKTMTAHAIANKLNKKLLIVNYAEIESKYVGETSKNIESLFTFAKNNDVVLFFDEADALLSKRVTLMQTASDVSVNQTRNVLLKLLDEYEGIVLFATNFLKNFDYAFLRRILFHIQFTLPNREQRKKLWLHYLPDNFPLNERKEELAEKLCEIDNISGSDISNAILRVAIMTTVKDKKEACYDELKYELEKIRKTKKICEWGNCSVTTRKVTSEYVKEQMQGDFNGIF